MFMIEKIAQETQVVTKYLNILEYYNFVYSVNFTIPFPVLNPAMFKESIKYVKVKDPSTVMFFNIDLLDDVNFKYLLAKKCNRQIGGIILNPGTSFEQKKSTLLSWSVNDSTLDLSTIKKLFNYLEPKLSASEISLVYAGCCKHGLYDLFVYLQEKYDIDPSEMDNRAIINVALNGNEQIFDILIADKRVNPACKNNVPLIMAAKGGHFAILKKLYCLPNVVPFSAENAAIRQACTYGHLEVAKFLLKDSRVDPAVIRNECIRQAAINNHAEIVELLLQDPRVEPRDEGDFAIQEACAKGNTNVVAVLLKDGRADPSANANAAFKYVCNYNHHEIVKLLIDDGRVDISCDDNEPLRLACEKGHAKVIELLLLKDVDVNCRDGFPLAAACGRRKLDAIKLLLNDNRIDPNGGKGFALLVAVRIDRFDIVKLLSEHPKFEFTLQAYKMAKDRDPTGSISQLFESDSAFMEKVNQAVGAETELLAWYNDLSQQNYTKVPLSKVKFNAKHEWEYVANFKVLQAVFDKHKIDNAIPVERLIKCKFQDNLEFLQWIKKFWDQYYPGGSYDSKATSGIKKKTASTAKPFQKSLSNNSVDEPPKPVRLLKTPKTAAAAAAGPNTHRDLIDEYQKVANDLTLQVNELKITVDQVEKEREFYFGKLREIEVYIQSRIEGGIDSNLDVAFKDIQNIMYKTEEGFEAPDPETELAEKQRSTSDLLKIKGAPNIIKYWGYPCEEHNVITRDGYHIGLQRIPYSRSQIHPTPSSFPVIVWHGLSNSSDMFVASNPESSLAFVLADAGFDVWLGNARGTEYSFKHEHLNLNDKSDLKKFWEFSIDHLANFDVPAVVDYVLSYTKREKVSYIGFSQGSAQAIAALALNDDLNHKINHLIGLAPAMKPNEIPDNFLSKYINMFGPQGLYYVLGNHGFFTIANSILPWCRSEHTRLIIKNILGGCLGWKMENLGEMERQLLLYRNIYSPTSVQSVVHWFQIMQHGRFSSYLDVQDVYKLAFTQTPSTTPPVRFPTKHITTSISLFCGKADNLSDIDYLRNNLPPHCDIYTLEGYEHLDTVWAIDAKEKIWDQVIEILQQTWSPTLNEQPSSRFGIENLFISKAG
ncbi:hypothetical protein HDV06_006656 [Boothiomyces sp. JEL0866]|nr:hypothetical protein HDV06_006656 [Boothiomyces sp. JEL0866]